MQKRFVQQTLIYLPSTLLPALTAFITIPILTRLFVPGEYGSWVLATGFSEFLLAAACLGLGSTAIRFYPAYKADGKAPRFFAALSVLTVVSIAVVSVVGFVVLVLLNGHLSVLLVDLFKISILIFIAQGFYTIFITVVRAQERSGLYSLFQLLSYYIGLVSGLLLVIVAGMGVEGLLWGRLLSLVLCLPFLISLASKDGGISSNHFHSPDIKEMWRYTWPLTIGNLALWALLLSDRYIIGLFRSAEEVGRYSVAYNISGRSIEMLVTLFLLGVSPMVLNTWEVYGRSATENVMTMITRLYLILCLPAAAGLSVLAKPIVSLLAADTYFEGYRIVGYVAFGSFFFGAAHIAQMGMVIGKEARRLGGNEVLAAMTNISLNLLLVPRFGFVVAGINTLFSYLVLLALHARASAKFWTWRIPQTSVRNTAIATLLMALFARGIYQLSGQEAGVDLGYLLLSVIGGALVYLGGLWWLREVNEEERAAIKNIWNAMAGKVTLAVNGRRT